MKISMEPTSDIVVLNGVHCRRWTKCEVMVLCLVTPPEAHDEFSVLREVAAPITAKGNFGSHVAPQVTLKPSLN